MRRTKSKKYVKKKFQDYVSNPKTKSWLRTVIKHTANGKKDLAEKWAMRIVYMTEDVNELYRYAFLFEMCDLMNPAIKAYLKLKSIRPKENVIPLTQDIRHLVLENVTANVFRKQKEVVKFIFVFSVLSADYFFGRMQYKTAKNIVNKIKEERDVYKTSNDIPTFHLKEMIVGRKQTGRTIRRWLKKVA